VGNRVHGNSEMTGPVGRQDARERILDAAYSLFAQYGTRSVGVDAIIERSGVAKMTLYRHFKSKQDLVLAFLERRGALWTEDG
jgi:AcrR family transcriptional regulator